MREEVTIVFENPNSQEDTARFLLELLAAELERKADDPAG